MSTSKGSTMRDASSNSHLKTTWCHSKSYISKRNTKARSSMLNGSLSGPIMSYPECIIERTWSRNDCTQCKRWRWRWYMLWWTSWGCQNRLGWWSLPYRTYTSPCIHHKLSPSSIDYSDDCCSTLPTISNMDCPQNQLTIFAYLDQ